MKKSSIILCATALALLACVPIARQTAIAASPGNLRTAIIYNVLRFVDFPKDSSTSQLRFCLRRGLGGVDAIYSLRGRTIGERTISVAAIDPENGSRNCDVVYLGAATSSEIAAVRDKGVLTIGEGSSFVGAGGTIGLVTTGKQIRFEVNMRSARQSRLVISSQLLRLASRVVQ